MVVLQQMRLYMEVSIAEVLAYAGVTEEESIFVSIAKKQERLEGENCSSAQAGRDWIKMRNSRVGRMRGTC